jgi:hypothetical protein
MSKDTRAHPVSIRTETFIPLLSALIIVLVFSPLAEGSPMLSMALISLVLITSVLALHRSMWLRGSMAIALLLTVGLRWLAHAYGETHEVLAPISHLAIGGYLSVLAALCVVVVVRRGKVTHDTVIGAVCGYLLIAFVFAFAYAALEDVMPGSFAGGKDLQNQNTHIGAGTPEFLYYSFVVLTTVGFGDITPSNPPARSLAMLEMLGGQLYLAAFVARLVGVMGSSSQCEGQNSCAE